MELAKQVHLPNALTWLVRVRQNSGRVACRVVKLSGPERPDEGSQRQRAHIFPRVEDARYVFLDMQGVIEPFQTQEEYRAEVETLRADSNFELITEQDGFILFERK